MTDIPILSLDTVDSTLAEAERQAAAGRRGPLLICAGSQTGGVGRHGRQWASPPGNLYWTMLLDDAADRPRDAGLAFAAGLAVRDAAIALGVAAERLRIKWPNDVLLDGRKLAGVLARASIMGGASFVVVGIGVNVASAPSSPAYPAVALGEIGPAPDLATLRDTVTAAFMVRRAEWHRAGVRPLRDAVAACLHGVGQTARVASDRERTCVREGVIENLDESGALLLRVSGGHLHALVAGDVLA